MKCKVEIRDRKVYAVHSYVELNEAIRRKMYFRIGIPPSELDEQAMIELAGKDVGCDTNSAEAWIYLGHGRHWRCQGPAGSTPCDFIETENVPAPKCKVETRWRNGCWYKYLKTKGWVVA